MPEVTASPAILGLDHHTLLDLEIFESTSSGPCLFEFCNFTRTAGGAKALRRRMENPPAEAARIREIQASIAFIQGQRALFDALPSAYASDSTEDYMRKILPAVDYRGWLEFVLGAVQIWSSQDSHFFSILRGVQCAAQMIQSLRQFTAQPGLAGVGGEFAPLLGDMKKLLARPELQRVPDHAVGGLSTWRLLRLDQLLRVQEKETVNQLLSLVYEMDALVSMADATVRHGFVMPQVDEGLPQVSGEGLFHPYLDKPVPNPVALDQQHRILFLTGPNMAGKTTYLRAFATALYLGHLGMGVPAASFRFAPVQRLFSSICLSDDLRSGVSYFRAEALRVKVVAEAVAQGEYVVALMDEPFKGTNVKDAFDASLAILQRLSTRPNCLFMFSSHHIELSEQLDTAHGQVDCRYFEAEESGGRLRFDYRLRPGVSGQRLGMRVLREEGIFDLLDSQEKATGTTSACARIERT